MTDSLPATIQEIRKQLRLAMNGVVSTSMREKGANYKLNFGVSFPRIREIAARYTPDAHLAEALWQEDVRELKILATLLYPADRFPREQAEQWATDTADKQEIAEYYAANLLSRLPYASELAADWIARQEELFQWLGFLLFTRLYMQDRTIDSSLSSLLLHRAKAVLDNPNHPSRLRHAALQSIKRYGRQSPTQAETVLSFFSGYPTSGSPQKEELYEDLHFEFNAN